MLAATLAVGCFEDPISPPPVDEGTASGSGTTAAMPTGTDTEPGPTTITESGPITGSTTQTTVDDTGTDSSSSGEPLPIECDDGLAAPGELCFGDMTVLMANDATFSARIGDVSGTSSKDLVHLIPDQVVVRVGSGNGNFGPAVYDASVVARRFELADFDGDGELDLAVVENEGTLRLLRGSGAGSFTSSDTTPVGDDPQALAVGDLDGDGNLDAVVGTGTGAQLHVVRGDGSGGWLPMGAVTSFGAVTGLSLADVDGDGTLDLAIAVDGGGWQGVALRRGLGDGTFGDQELTAGAMGSARSVVTGDFDGDNRIDIAYVSTASDALGVLLGDGSGFPSEVVASTGSSPSVLLAVDLDNDGHEDLVVGHQGETALRIFVADPGGRITQGLQVPLAAPVSALHAGDLNDDGVPDLAATSSVAEIITLVLSTP